MASDQSKSRDEAKLNQRVEALLCQMTLKEKVALLSGRDAWNTNPIDRLGIPVLTMTDGPNGVRADNAEFGRPAGPATAFPTGIAMGSTWDPSLVRKAAEAMAEETLAMNCDVLLGPCVNIIRAPLGGRNFETYAEDPYLAGEIGKAWIDGVQSKGVGASLKHFAANNQEVERFRVSSEVDERTLREIYLPAFETCVKETQPWTVMCSYNRINGVHASQNGYLLNQILRDEWGFQGFVVSDWGANHTTTESVQNGLDLEMPGPAKYYGKLLSEAIYHWQIEEKVIDQAVRRILRVILLTSKMDGADRSGSLNTKEHQSVAREVAEESVVLLKNAGDVLPLDLGKIKTLAVIGPNAVEMVTGGGGSSRIKPPYKVNFLQGLQNRLGSQVKIEYEQGCENFVNPPTVRAEWLSIPGGEGSGLKAEYYTNVNLSGRPELVRAERRPDFWWFSSSPADVIPVERFSARWTGALTVSVSGNYVLQFSHSGRGKLYLDDQLLVDSTAPNYDKFEESTYVHVKNMELSADRSYALKIEFQKHEGQEFAHVRLGMALASPEYEEQQLERAIQLAMRSDAVLVFVGDGENHESEGSDRASMDLPGRQDELIRKVAAANPNTVVVLNAGAPMALPWIDQVAGLVLAHLPGQEGGDAIARVLAGDVNPSGKLTSSWPKRLEDNPAFDNSGFPYDRKILYGEGIFVGYRYYDHRDLDPRFPFGHGLSYTQFEYSDLKVPTKVKSGESFEVSVKVTNTGSREGKEVVQLYVSDKQASLPRPVKELKGFQKVSLKPGESVTVRFKLEPRALSFYDTVAAQWVCEPGEFAILTGSSSRDIRLQTSFELVK